jgi:hypothetical protein
MTCTTYTNRAYLPKIHDEFSLVGHSPLDSKVFNVALAKGELTST